MAALGPYICFLLHRLVLSQHLKHARWIVLAWRMPPSAGRRQMTYCGPRCSASTDFNVGLLRCEYLEGMEAALGHCRITSWAKQGRAHLPPLRRGTANLCCSCGSECDSRRCRAMRTLHHLDSIAHTWLFCFSYPSALPPSPRDGLRPPCNPPASSRPALSARHVAGAPAPSPPQRVPFARTRCHQGCTHAAQHSVAFSIRRSRGQATFRPAQSQRSMSRPLQPRP